MPFLFSLHFQGLDTYRLKLFFSCQQPLPIQPKIKKTQTKKDPEKQQQQKTPINSKQPPPQNTKLEARCHSQDKNNVFLILAHALTLFEGNCWYPASLSSRITIMQVLRAEDRFFFFTSRRNILMSTWSISSLIHFCPFQSSKSKLVPERSDESGQVPSTIIHYYCHWSSHVTRFSQKHATQKNFVLTQRKC